jgi:molybdopterin-binding protein
LNYFSFLAGPEGSERKTFKIETQCIGATEQHAGIKEMATMADVQLRTDSLHLRCRITEEARNELALMKDDKIYAIFKATSPQVILEES